MTERSGVFDETVSNPNVRDRYELSDDEAQQGAGQDGFNYPVVKIPSAVGSLAHGGSAGCVPNKPLVILQDKHHKPFVSCDTTNLPPEIAERVNKRALELMPQYGNDAGKAIRIALQESLAVQKPDGSVIDTMNVWVSGGADPFRRKVVLPPARYQLNKKNPSTAKKGSAMHHPSFPATTPPTVMPGFPAQTTAMPGTFPGGHSVAMKNTVHVPRTGPHGQPLQGQPAMVTPAQLPEPKELLVFHLAGIEITTKWHKLMMLEGSLATPQGETAIDLLVLIRNGLAPGADTFAPKTPAAGAAIGISFADGTTRFIHSVLANYKVGHAVHYLLLLHPNTPVAPEASEPVIQANAAAESNYDGMAEPFPTAPVAVPVDVETMLSQDLDAELTPG
jgi:hypothetical protein